MTAGAAIAAAEPRRWPTVPCAEEGCAAEVIVARTNGGGRMPVDAEPVDGGNVLLRPWPGRVEPEAHVVGSPGRLVGAEKYTSHVPTCAATSVRPRRSRRTI